MKIIDAKNKNVLLIGDSHLPYEHCDYLAFCKAVKKKYKCLLVIHMGDYEDQHAISFHDSDVDLYSAGHELEIVIEKTKHWYKAFNKMVTLDSNHGSLVIRNFKKRGIPMQHMRALKEVYNTPNWNWFESILLRTNAGDTLLRHNKSTTYQKFAREEGCNCWQGHYHGKAEITWCNTEYNERYNAFTGCGVNKDSLALAYGKANIPQPILSCGRIDQHGMPHVVKMNLDKKGRWDGNIS